MALKKYSSELKHLTENIKTLLKQKRNSVNHFIQNEILLTYWEIGKLISVKETENNIDVKSSRVLILELSKILRNEIGKGFSRSNLTYMRLLFLNYPNGVTLSHQLSWSHYIELLKIEDNLERSFYEQQSTKEKWSVRELRRQKDSSLFQRLALSKNSDGILKLAKEGQTIVNKSDIIKDPYILEFLGIPEENKYSEKELESRIVDNLQQFLLELGKGFAFIGRQYRITLNNTHFYVDLVFYHRILKCFVIIDLKVGEVKHTDIGQMNMYLNYFKEEENVENDNQPIGIILVASKDDIMVKYATGGLSNNIFVSKYQLYLPDKDLLQERIKRIIDNQ